MIQQKQLDLVMGRPTSQPQTTQLVDTYCTPLSIREHHRSHYLKEGKQHHIKADKWDPEFIFHGQLKQVIRAYRVKPAVFSMLLAICFGTHFGAPTRQSR